MQWVLFDIRWFCFYFLLEIDGFEEGLCGDNPQHGEGGGGTYYGIRKESDAVSAGALLDERRGASDAFKD